MTREMNPSRVSPEHTHPPRSEPRVTARDLAQIATFTGVVAALGLAPAIYPLGIPVPVTAQTLGVMLAGAVLGARRGAAALALFLALIALGLPLLAGGRGGLAVFAGPSVGYLVGFPLAAWVIGAITQRAGSPYRLHWGVAANLLGGIVVLYTLGIAGTAWRADLSLPVAALGASWYLAGDIVKAVLAAVVARGVHAAYGGQFHTPDEVVAVPR
jgi:biotin transport system substrate-specific component